MKNPWTVHWDTSLQTTGVEERLRDVKVANVERLREIIAWLGTEKTVRDRAESRLRRLLKEPKRTKGVLP